MNLSGNFTAALSNHRFTVLNDCLKMGVNLTLLIYGGEYYDMNTTD